MKQSSKLVLWTACLALAAQVMIVTEPPITRAAGPWYVAPGGSDSNDCLGALTPCATINGAIGKASSGDTILLAIGTYTGTGTEVVLVNKDIPISGGWDSSFVTHSGLSTIDAQSSRRGIVIGSTANATVGNVLVQNGNLGCCTQRGAGIHNEGALTLNASVVQSNTAAYGGGGIEDYAGILVINDSYIIGNTASGSSNYGGGIWNNGGTMTLNNSFIISNSSGADGYAGGIFDGSPSTTFTLSHTTVSGNIGGGIENYARMTMTNSAVSNNTRSGISNGGSLVANGSTVSGNSQTGILNFATLNLNNSTVSGNSTGGISNSGTASLNSSTISSNPSPYWGGGVSSAGGTVTLKNTIVSGNSPVTGHDCFGNISSAGYNLIGDATGCSFSATTGDLIGQSAVLGPLQDNGGSTLTLAQLFTSPTINAGNPSGCTDNLGNLLSTDQRGMSRVGRCDIGAYEYTGQIYQAFLPSLYAPIRGIFGRVTFVGASASGIPLDLRFYNGSAWSTISSTLTDGSGNYSFQSAPTLGAGQGYYVRYSNSADSSKLFFWGTQILTSYAAGSGVVIGNFDIANIPLVSPPNAATVSLPQTFQWTLRTATPTDSYQLSLFDPSNANLTAYTPLLGYVNAVTINGLPPGFNAGVPYGWFMAVNSPDGGYGESYYYRQITFTNTGAGPSKFAPASNRLNRTDLPLPKHQR